MRVTPREWRTIAAGTAVVVLLLVTMRGIPAWQRWESDRVASARELQRAEVQARRMIARHEAARDSLTVRLARLADRRPALLNAHTTSLAAAQLASLVSEAADEAGMRVQSVQPRPDTSRVGALVRVSVRASLTGDAAGLTTMLLHLETGMPLVAIRELHLAQPEPAAADERPEELRIEIVVDGLLVSRSVEESA